jgi:hypothetical protein
MMGRTTLVFEDVCLEHIGKGGVEDDISLIELGNQELTRLCQALKDPRRGDSGTLNIKVKATLSEDGGHVIFSGGVDAKLPQIEVRGLTAQISASGRVITAQHKQEHIVFDKIDDDEDGPTTH